MLNSIGLLLGSSWACGINLYLTIAGLGIAQRLDWIDLPGDMGVVSHSGVIILALILYIIEFFADKIPYVDSTWDSIHTFIRPAGGAILGYLAMAEAGPALQFSIALITGTISADAHLTKATTRAAINTFPESVSNSVVSIAEDVSAAGVLVLIMNHPVIAAVFVILFFLFSIWFLKKMFRFLKKALSFIFGGGSRKENNKSKKDQGGK